MPASHMNHRRTSGQHWAPLWLWLVVLQFFASTPLHAIGLAHAGPAGTKDISFATPAVHGLYLYTGEQIDPDLGMYYLRARYYLPATGRFWTMDSFEGRQRIPLTLHKYLYCHANPVNAADPSGHDAGFSFGGFMAAASIQGAIGGALSGGISYALHGDPGRAARAAGVGFGVGFAGGGAVYAIRWVMAARAAAAELAAGGLATGLGTGAVLIPEGEVVIGIVMNGRVVTQSVLNAGAGHIQAARAAGALAQGTSEPTLVAGAEAFTAIKAGGEITVAGSGTFHGIGRLATISDEAILAVRAFFH